MASLIRRGFAAVAGCAFAMTVQAEKQILDTITVTATGIPTEVQNFGGSVTVLTEADIQRLQQPTVADLLRTVPGVDVTRSGGVGKSTSVFIRGAESDHTLVLIDGVEVNDPADPAGRFDFSTLQVSNIERIEILRGPQSILYGSNAIGGVIQIFTKQGSGKPAVYGGASGGSFGTYQVNIGSSGTYKGLNYSLSADRYDSDGISAADENNGNREDDSYGSNTFSGKADYDVSDWLAVGGVVRYVDAETEIDGTDISGIPIDDRDSVQENDELYTKLAADTSWLEGRWRQTFSVEYTDIRRENRNGPDAQIVTFFGTLNGPAFDVFEGDKLSFRLLNHLSLPYGHHVSVGLETEEETVDTSTGVSEDARIHSVFIQDQVQFAERFNLTAGLRHDDHSDFGSETTWRVTGSVDLYEIGVTLRGSVATGFKAPALFELFDPFFGNPDLQAEESIGWEAGFDYRSKSGNIGTGITVFRQEFDDLIQASSTFPFIPVNIGEAESEGFELYGFYSPLANLNLRVDYTNTDAINKQTGLRLLRRPEDKVVFTLNYRPLPKVTTSLGVHHVGARRDFLGPVPGTIDAYTVVNAAASYDVNRWLSVQARIDNVLDEEYQEVFGFGTPDRSAFVGMHLRYE